MLLSWLASSKKPEWQFSGKEESVEEQWVWTWDLPSTSSHLHDIRSPPRATPFSSFLRMPQEQIRFSDKCTAMSQNTSWTLTVSMMDYRSQGYTVRSCSHSPKIPETSVGASPLESGGRVATWRVHWRLSLFACLALFTLRPHPLISWWVYFVGLLWSALVFTVSLWTLSRQQQMGWWREPEATKGTAVIYMRLTLLDPEHMW